MTVQLDPSREKVQVSEENVHVPPGVDIIIRRTRTVEHTLEIGDTTSTSTSSESGMQLAGLLDVKGSIEKAIEKQQNKTYSESEAMEYEVHLHGEPTKTSTYCLIWTECWRTGAASVQQGPNVTTTRIRFKESAELEVQKCPDSVAPDSLVYPIASRHL